MLDRDGSRTPIQFHISNDRDLHPIDAQVVQAATKWKRLALRQFGMGPGEGLCTDMRAVRKDYFLDHDHSVYVDQWDWEKVITAAERDLAYLKHTVRAIWRVLRGAEAHVQDRFPAASHRPLSGPARGDHVPPRRGDPRALSRPCRASSARRGSSQDFPAVFIIGIGWTLADGYPHEMRAADYDDWATETVSRRRPARCTG